MNNLKNVTPKQLAQFVALLLAMVVLIVYLLMKSILGNDDALYTSLILFTVTGLLAYGAFYYSIELFLYRKIKVIYKIIRQLKAPIAGRETQDLVNMNKDVLTDVEGEVIDWAAEKSAEIEKLTETAAFRREFLGNVSHELKTPLFAVQGYIETLANGGLHDPKINMEYLLKAGKNVERLNQILEDLEFITTHEEGKLQITKRKFLIHDLVQEVFDSLEIAANAEDVNLRFKDGIERNTVVYADREKIQQVLTNLIQNSIKYGKEDGTTFLGIYHLDKNVLVEVTDNGMGIEEKHLPRLFERFYRIDSSRSRQQGGSGLGLAIVKHIVEAHGQSINVRSKVDVGTTIGFTLEKA